MKATFKKPEEMCACLLWMEEQGLIRFGQAMRPDGSEFLMPIIDHQRKRSGPFVKIAYCPNCGEPTFVMEQAQEATAQESLQVQPAQAGEG